MLWIPLAALEITDAKGVVIQRGHNPAKRGDNKSAQPQIRAALDGKSAKGLTISPTTGEAAELRRPAMSAIRSLSRVNRTYRGHRISVAIDPAVYKREKSRIVLNA
jgi:hypothetical protein